MSETNTAVLFCTVNIVSTDASRACQLAGECDLILTKDDIILRQPPFVHTFPYKYIRRYGSCEHSFNFETGRRCKSGPGFFTLATKPYEGDVINNTIKSLIDINFTNSFPTRTPPAPPRRNSRRERDSYLELVKLNEGVNVPLTDAPPPPPPRDVNEPLANAPNQPCDLNEPLANAPTPPCDLNEPLTNAPTPPCDLNAPLTNAPTPPGPDVEDHQYARVNRERNMKRPAPQPPSLEHKKEAQNNQVSNSKAFPYIVVDPAETLEDEGCERLPPPLPTTPRPGKQQQVPDLDGNQQMDVEKLKEQTLCKICLDEPLAVTFLPCGHFVTCNACSGQVSNCPVCRERIKKRVKTFM